VRALMASVGEIFASRRPYFRRGEARQRLVEPGTTFAVHPRVIDKPSQPSGGSGHFSGTVFRKVMVHVIYRPLQSTRPKSSAACRCRRRDAHGLVTRGSWETISRI